MLECIFCNLENEAKAVEHIVSESLGNQDYIMPKGAVCDVCNNKFAKFEQTALVNSVFIMERARFGVKTKRKKNAKGKVEELEIEGDEDFRKNYLTVKGLNSENFKLDPTGKTGSLRISSFDKSDVAASKLVLKIGLEALFKSQPKIYSKYDFKELRSFLLSPATSEWPFLTSDFELEKFLSVPTQNDKYLLKVRHCELKFLEYDEETLLFKFKFGAIPITINLLNRSLGWISKMLAHEQIESLYPEHYRKKV
jgi:hypothetical protein